MTKIAGIIRAAAVSLALGATAVTALPVQAATFHFGFGTGSSVFLRHPIFCFEMTDSQLRAAIRAKGYRNIYLNVANNHRIQIRATRDGWVYLLKVSTCTGRILDRQRLRRA